MSYLQNQSPVGIWPFSDPSTSFSDEDCVIAADSATAGMFANQERIRKNWNPTGLYTPEDLRTVIAAGHAMMTAAGRVLDAALDEAQDQTSRAQLMKARDGIFDQQRREIPFMDAARDAVAKNKDLVDAPGLKRWVIGAMQATQGAIFTSNYVACNRPFLLSVMVAFFGAFKTAADVIMRIVGAVLRAGETVLKVAESFDTIVKVSLVAGGALGAFWLWQKFGKSRSTQR